MTALNILFLGSQMTIGGAQRVLFDQADWFHKKGYRVTTAFLYDRDGLAVNWSAKYPFPVIDLQAFPPGGEKHFGDVRLVRAVARLNRIIIDRKVNVIETFTPHANLIGIPVAWLAGVPCRIASYHGEVENLSRILVKLHALVINSRMAGQLVTVSDAVRDQVIRDGVSSKRIRTIYNGIHLASVSSGTRQKIRLELGVDADAPLILSVGRLVAQKGQSTLIHAASRINNKFPRARFVVIGDGPLRETLEAEIDHLSLQHKFLLPGARENIFDYLAAADLFVLPSLSEGLGVALLEAMGGGLASVATRIGGITEIIRDGENGLLVPPDDPAALADSIVKLLTDSEERGRMGSSARAAVESGFLVDQMCEQYLSAFLSCLS